MLNDTRYRARDYPVSYKGTRSLTDAGVVVSSTPTQTDLWQFGTISDGVHPVHLLGRTARDIGGPMTSFQYKTNFPSFGDECVGKFASLEYRHDGPIIANPLNVAFTSWQAQTAWSIKYTASQASMYDNELGRKSMGTTAISRCKPASPEASLGVFLIETYREGIPSLLSNFREIKDEVEEFRSLQFAGGNYLNVEFGWKPFVSDLRKTARAVQNADRILEDLRRNSGKRMRRRYEFPEYTRNSTLHVDMNLPLGTAISYSGSTQDERRVTLHEHKKTWFEGEFVYTFPGANSPIPKKVLAGARQILGLDLTPETLWNMSPWTWLADWFANSGDVVANVSAINSDNLVMRYGYLMQEVERRTTVVHKNFRTNYSVLPSTISGESVSTFKSRIGASPYGFGLTIGDFSPRQVAILASIGITRV